MTRPVAQLRMGFPATMAGSSQSMSLRSTTLAEDSAGLPMETPFGVWLPQVTILDCRRLEQAVQALEALRARHCLVLQLARAEPQEAQRIVDFMAGAVSALDGQVERLGDDAFLFSPAGVIVSRS